MHMKRSIALTVVAALSQAVAAFAGPEAKQVMAPAPPPPPEYFRPNEFDIGAFATWVDFPNSRNVGGSVHGWGGGMDFTYWFPWKYAGVRFQGTGLDLQSGIGHTSRTTDIFGNTVTVHGGGGSIAAGVINADVLLRLPLDDFWPCVHLAPYVFGGFGGIFVGGGGEGRAVSETVIVSNVAGTQSRAVTITGRRINTLRNNIGTDRVLGRIGGGLEYRFTPHIGIFTEAAYVIPNGSSNNFVQWNFIGLRYAF
jgi:hypothetical protein